MPKSFFAQRSLLGLIIRLTCLWGLCLAAWLAWGAVHNTPVHTLFGQVLVWQAIQQIWQTLFLTAALWCTARIFDDLKTRQPINETLLRALFRIGAFVAVAEVPSFLNPFALMHRGEWLQFDYLSFIILVIAICFMLVTWQVRRLRAEVDAFV